VATDPGPFKGVQGRSSVDYMLRNTQQQMVALGGQADFKASVMITASAIVTSIAAAQLPEDDIRSAAVVLMTFTTLALLASVIAVFPKFTRYTHERGEPRPDFNALFFGHYAQMDKDDFLHEMADIVRDDGAIYRTIVNDLYDQGVYLMAAKYKWLRLSYACFFIGFLAAPLTLLVSQLVD
jgi:hypothetical protein